ncbi:hypothetical protein CDD83_1151 [Cordyceps sp. RAO-2017]|nr:hypothetical protein CDD83_1151 [Cordyceps sp. RAO-2017]
MMDSSAAPNRKAGDVMLFCRWRTRSSTTQSKMTKMTTAMRLMRKTLVPSTVYFQYLEPTARWSKRRKATLPMGIQKTRNQQTAETRMSDGEMRHQKKMKKMTRPMFHSPRPKSLLRLLIRERPPAPEPAAAPEPRRPRPSRLSVSLGSESMLRLERPTMDRLRSGPKKSRPYSRSPLCHCSYSEMLRPSSASSCR